ncbi:MAG: hypothetical protein JST58_12450 [Bacteroidetes bacterium]|nr:hypothetical protein [Bacteroidota bacterium]
MTSATPLLARTHTVQRLNQLLHALLKAKKKLEGFAAGIKNKQTHETIISLATENNQYANELSSLIKSLGGEPKMIQDKPEPLQESTIAEKNILEVCEKNEMLLTKAYKKVLNESYIYDSLKKMIGYQLNGIKGSISKLNLLNKLQGDFHS